jgi:hypothetical protein
MSSGRPFRRSVKGPPALTGIRLHDDRLIVHDRPTVRRSLRCAFRLAAVVAVLAACSAGGGSPAAGDVIDGFVLGPLEKCSSPVAVPPTSSDRTCSAEEALATEALDSRYPGHAAIETVQQFADGNQPGPIEMTGAATLPPMPSRHPGPAVAVFVFVLSDGSVRATGTSCAGLEPCIGVATYPG